MNQASSFVHLHVHTQYSLLDGAIRIKPLFEKIKALEMPAVAITDLNNLFGAIDFYFAAEKVGVNPIIGCEVLFRSEGRFSWLNQLQKGMSNDRLKPRYHHLVLLCKNQKGYQNLCQLVTKAYLDAPEHKRGQPSGKRELIDRELLEQYKEGLVVLTGGLRGEASYHFLKGEDEKAYESIDWLHEQFGEDLYLELQDTGIPEQAHINELLFEYGKKKKIKCVATNECHYLEAKDAEAQEVLQSIDQNRELDFDRPKSLVPPEYYLKSAEQMRERFARFPEACDTTLEVAEKCRLEFEFVDQEGKPIYHLPNFRPEGVSKSEPFDTEKYFAEVSLKGLEKRFQETNFGVITEEMKKDYYERLDAEVKMISKTGFCGYFLIVADFVNWAQRNGIPVGPGRGSGAGSLVAYSLRITNIDPIKFNLLFERFINPERISLPDFDIDLCQARRGEVIDYVSQKYGKENVCQIITFGKLQPRAVLKDVGRVFGLTFAETDQITKLFPDVLNISLQEAIDQEPRLQELIQSDAKISKVFEYALSLEGLYRNAGIHAAGVIITENPVVTYCPLYSGKDGDVVTQFDKDFSEKIGLVKFDFLGLKTLTVIDQASKLVQKKVPDFNIETIHLEDPKVFELIGSGDTDGVFQVESSGMKDLCLRLLPGNIEDLTAINALYRPGPLGSGMVDDFIDCKHGRKEIQYEVESLKPILKDTYGVILYQEQVMQIARELAGYSLGQADMLRRAMGKKKADEMQRHQQIFTEGALKKGLTKQKAETIFNLMAKFAEYGFNKSHSAAYAMLTYQTAYLKAYYPAEFMAALMTTEMSNTEKLSKYIADARSHSIEILTPDVNVSQKVFTVEKGSIRFALEAIKGVGGSAVDAIMEARRKPTLDAEIDENSSELYPFENVLDFVRRVPNRKVNKKVMESLTLAGAFDGIAEVNRATIFASIEPLIDHASEEQEERSLGQSSLFDQFTSDEVQISAPASAVFDMQEDWPKAKKLSHEKKVVGFYVSGHPMDGWQPICEHWLGWTVEKLKIYAAEQKSQPQPKQEQQQGWGRNRPRRKEIQLAGLFTEMKEIMTKKGSRMAFATFEDLYGKVEVVCFPDPYAASEEIIRTAIQEAQPIILKAEVELKDEVPKLLLSEVRYLEKEQAGKQNKLVLKLNPSEVKPDQLRDLKKMFMDHRGTASVSLFFENNQYRTALKLPEEMKVDISPQLISKVSKLFGSKSLTIS